MESDLARVSLLLRSIEFDRLVLSILLPTEESIQANREAGFESTARTLKARRAARITKRPGLLTTERIVLERIAGARDELQRLGVHI